MKVTFNTLVFVWLFLITTVLAQTPPVPPAGTPLPELEAIRGPYQRNLQAILAERQKRVAAVTNGYLVSLERLQQEIAARGDLEGGLQIKAERERAKAAQEPT